MALVLVALSCHRSPKPPTAALNVARQPLSSLLRLPAQGGFPQLYLPPGLTEADWKAQTKLPPIRHVIGADLDERLVYSLDASGQIQVLDLETGRVRALLPGVRDAVMGPDRTIYALDDSNAVTQVVHRSPTKYRNRLPGRPREMFGTKDGDLLAVSTAGGNALARLAGDQPATTTPLPAGDAAVTYWGELLAVAADSVVVLYEPRGKAAPRTIAVDGHARAVAFSPSGHRLYVARRQGGILVLNRFTSDIAGEIDIPSPALAIRSDPYGRWLLVRPPATDSVWLVDLGTGKFTGSVATEWGVDLPTVTNQQILVGKIKQDVLAYDLSKANFPVVGKVGGGAKDFWLALPWSPVEVPPPSVSESTAIAAAPGDTTVRGRVYLQVSSSQNPAWAEELAKQLGGAGLPASVLKPHAPDEGYRVVLGPYSSREDAEATGKKLGRPFFIYQPEAGDR